MGAAGEHLVQDHAQGVDVAAHVDRRDVAARLLRAHVRDGAADHALVGERAVLGRVLGQRARPKSRIFTTGVAGALSPSSGAAMTILRGFRSRWITPRWCA